MKNLLQRLQSTTRDEQGFTLAELVVVIALIPVLATLCLNIVISASENTAQIANKTMGVAQGIEADLAKQIGLAGKKFVQDNSVLPEGEQVPLSKQALLDANSALANSIPDDMDWTVAARSYGNSSPEVCSIVYSTDVDKASKYTKENPAEWNNVWGLNGSHHLGCWIMTDGKLVPDYNETPRSAVRSGFGSPQTVQL